MPSEVPAAAVPIYNSRVTIVRRTSVLVSIRLRVSAVAQRLKIIRCCQRATEPQRGKIGRNVWTVGHGRRM